jgi:hypothetical protein
MIYPILLPLCSLPQFRIALNKNNISKYMYIRYEFFTAVTMKNGVFWDVSHVALVRTGIWEELSASFSRVTRIDELGTTLAITSNRRMLRRNTTKSHTA